VPRVDSIFPPSVVLPRQIQYSVPIGRALGFVLRQSEGWSHWNLVSLDPHIIHLNGEGGGEHRDAIPLEGQERLVGDLFPLEQDA
jgi:hypothetical protein